MSVSKWGGLALLLATAAMIGFSVGRATAPEPPPRYGCAPTASTDGAAPVVVTQVC